MSIDVARGPAIKGILHTSREATPEILAGLGFRWQDDTHLYPPTGGGKYSPTDGCSQGVFIIRYFYTLYRLCQHAKDENLSHEHNKKRRNGDKYGNTFLDRRWFDCRLAGRSGR